MTFVSFEMAGNNSTGITLEEAERLFLHTSIGTQIRGGAIIAPSQAQALEMLDRIAARAEVSEAAGELRKSLMAYAHAK
jgi:hypothetical protein